VSALLSLAVACAVCFQADGSATTTGIRAAVATLVLITGGVLISFAVFVRRFIHRAADDMMAGSISDTGPGKCNPTSCRLLRRGDE
jgi:hypothetical protein